MLFGGRLLLLSRERGCLASITELDETSGTTFLQFMTPLLALGQVAMFVSKIEQLARENVENKLLDPRSP